MNSLEFGYFYFHKLVHYFPPVITCRYLLIQNDVPKNENSNKKQLLSKFRLNNFVRIIKHVFVLQFEF